MRLRFYAFGNAMFGEFGEGRYVRFPQNAQPRLMYILFADGSAGKALDRFKAEKFPAGSPEALKVKTFFEKHDSGPCRNR